MTDEEKSYTAIGDVDELNQYDVLTDTLSGGQAFVESVGVDKVHFRDGTEASHGYVTQAMVKIGNKPPEDGS